MKNYHIYISPNANKDLDKIYHYVAEELGLPDSANQLYENITGQIYQLTEFPRRYPPVQSEPERSQGVRILPAGSYSALYIVQETTVFIKNIVPSSSRYIAKLRGNQ